MHQSGRGGAVVNLKLPQTAVRPPHLTARSRIFLIFLAAVIGSLLGAYAPSSAAGTGVRLWVSPPVEQDGKNAFLTSGWWHSSDAVSLDWDDVLESGKAFDRAWGFSSDPQAMVRAYGRVSYGGAEYLGCDHTVWTDIFDERDNWMLSIAYVHTYQPQVSQVDYRFSSKLEWNSGIHIANMIPFRDSCPWAGAHIHQSYRMASAAGVRLNSDLYPRTVPRYALPFLNSSKGNWIYEFWWD